MFSTLLAVLGFTQSDLRTDYHFHIRWMIRRDMAETQDISRRTGGLCEEEMIAHLRQRNCIGMVAEVNNMIVAYFIYELHNDRLQFIDLKIHPEWTNCGLEQAFTPKFNGKLSINRRWKFQMEIDADDIDQLITCNSLGMKISKHKTGWLAYYVFNNKSIREVRQLRLNS